MSRGDRIRRRTIATAADVPSRGADVLCSSRITTRTHDHRILITHFVTHLVRPHQPENSPGRPGVGGLVHGEAHPCFHLIIIIIIIIIIFSYFPVIF